jgi:Protease inhibitor Inh
MLEPAMSGLRDVSALTARIAKAAIVILALATASGCANQTEAPPEVAAAPPPPPPPQPPPIQVTGRWRLTAGGGACFMNFTQVAGTGQGTIAPEGGCPGSFFTSRKWTFEHGALIIRDHKSDVLAELSLAGGRFEGHQTGGGALSLSR